MSTYFSYLPEVYVRTSSYRTNNVDPYVLAKNIFRRIKIRENLDDIVLGFSQYTIPNNSRPEQVAYEFYGRMEYDWVVLLTNNIINVYDEWPMTEHELYQYMVRKYGPANVESIHNLKIIPKLISNHLVMLLFYKIFCSFNCHSCVPTICVSTNCFSKFFI